MKLVNVFPLIILKTLKNESFLINVHQTSYRCDEIDELLRDDETPETPVQNEIHLKKKNKEKKESSAKPGCKSIVEQFPNIPEITTEFIKKNGYKAQERRGNNEFVSCGVTVEEVLKHLLDTVVGLAEYGVSKSTIRYIIFVVINGFL